MTKYESGVKYANAQPEQVFTRLSDLTHLEVIRQNISTPEVRERILAQAGGKVTPEQLDLMAERLQQMAITPDSISMEAGPLGTVTLHVVEREPDKMIKLEAEGLPMQANLWIQLLPNGDGRTAMKATIGAEMNFLMKQMLKDKLNDAADKMAEVLAMLPY